MKLLSLALGIALLGSIAGRARAVEAVKGQPFYPDTTHSGLINVCVLDYEVGYQRYRYENRRDDDRRDDRYDYYGRRRRRSYSDDLGRRFANEVVQQLVQSGRFEVYNRDRIVRWPFPLEMNADGAVSAETARRIGEASGAGYVVSGEVEIGAMVREYEEKSSDKKRPDKVRRCYETKVEVAVLHVATNTRDGAVWRQTSVEKTASKTFYDDEPDERDVDDLVFKTARDTGRGFVRQLVPAVEGKVIGKNLQTVVVGMGRADGVGLDVDFTFYRLIEMRDAAGQVLTDPQTGQPLRRKVAIQLRPTPKHREPFPVIGRPVQVEDAFTTVSLGYNGSGGFFGPEFEFKPRDNFITEIREGDIVVMTPRPADAK